ncbi:MAG: hypothetical protein KGJ93_05455 [Patescibacteria group bacterium]|nr:hypothetical protein [Patescibacteria group bacterium]
MRAAKIIAAIATIVYLYFAFRPPFNLTLFAKILADFNQSIQPIIVAMVTVSLTGAVLNAGFIVYLIKKDLSGQKIKHLPTISLSLLILPMVLMYILFVIGAGRVYNLGN